MAKEIIEEETLIPEEVEEEEVEEGGDNGFIVPPLEEEPTEGTIRELKTVEKGNEETEDVFLDTEIKQPKPVEGETAKEKALRSQIQELREKIRNKDEVIKIAQPLISNEEYEALKETYDDEELEKFEKLFDVIGKKKGYVKAEDVYKDKGQDILNNFLEKHSEYSLEKDPKDERWNTFKKILDRDYNRVGKTPTELSKLFEKVNRDVLEELGETDKKVISSSQQRNAELQKIRSVSHTGGTKTEVVKKSNAPTDPNVRKLFKGFDDDDF
jgi:hypothetical protein